MASTASDLDGGRLLLELTRQVTSSLDLQQVLDTGLATLRRLIDFNGGSIQLIEDGWLRMVAGDPSPPPEAFAFRLPVGEGFGGRVASTGEPIYSPDATVDPRAHPEGRKRASVAGTRSWFGAPLIVQGQTIGVVQLDDLEVDKFPPPVQERVLMFLPIISAAVQNAQLFGREREALARLQEADRLKRDFVATVSHELRTPLTVVHGFSTMLANGVGLDDNAQLMSIGERIRRAAERLDSIVSDMLHISGVASGHLSLSMADTDVAGCVHRAIEASDRGSHVIEQWASPDVAPAWTDEGRLVEALSKLLDNAQRFSADATTIRVTVEQAGDDVVIRVADEGYGIPEHMLERIFEPFVQVDSSETRPAGGMGTGLFIARTLLTAMNGSLSVSSGGGQGSQFVARIPRSRLD